MIFHTRFVGRGEEHEVRVHQLAMNSDEYAGVVATQWDDDNGVWVKAFSALSSDGVTAWGSEVAIARVLPETIVLPDRSAV